MKTLNITFTDAEYDTLYAKKQKYKNFSWHAFFMRMCRRVQ